MPSASPTISIKYDVFRWLYDTSGYTEAELTKELSSIKSKTWNGWMANRRDPELTLPQLKELASLYKRPVTAFLIDAPPRDPIIPKDFRRNAGSLYSKDLHRIFRRAHRKLELFREMAENLEENVASDLTCCTTSDDPFLIAEREREIFSADHIFSEKNADKAYPLWRTFFAEKGVPIFQYNMKNDGVRGFITKSGTASAIIVNSGDKPEARIFTIFHEYAHLLLGTGAICTDDGEKSTDPKIQEIERWCNNFAGAFLMPSSLIENNTNILTKIESEDYGGAASELAKETATSKTAALVRLVVVGKITQKNADPLLSALINVPKKQIEDPDSVDEEETGDLATVGTKKSSGGPDRALLTVRGLGEAYVNLAQKNYERGHISYASFLENVGISKKSHERLKKRGVLL
ncbi:ImmA/IrrE family metallo-endopeptidase [Methanocorpusculum sp. MG]|uniref:ImmA/IrrE family metallo-endopeptidase n=1 Tax=Methanocorpusculum petauri TaxID=3002863 RepID=A0ABT4IEA7_9EURY|nr:ImmA/IrrE family metallo-endopeptidase [Methanocorpusculum petauri]MCZ0860068.1 ImmA/IrrE family metallo-endopeptidase [Methanocorpusculum petauri]